ncbi:MAG: DEAD/DEAH box helicase [Verrucomicrobiota bacterium]
MDVFASRSQVLDAVQSLANRWGGVGVLLENQTSIKISKRHMVKGELKGLDAVVQTKDEDFTVKYAGLRNTWSVDCSCGSTSGCAHTLLALCQALDMDVTSFGPGTAGDQEDRDSEVKKQAPASGFEDEIAARLGRPLKKDESTYLRKVKALFDRFGGARSLTGDALDPFLGAKRLGASEVVELWPLRPKGYWEGWLYLAIFLKNRGISLPPFLAPLTTPAELSSLEGEWESRQALRHWEDNLDKMLGDLDAAQNRLWVKARLVIGSDAARLQWKRPEDEDWNIVGERQFTELSQQLSEGRVDCSPACRALLEAFCASSMGNSEIGYLRVEGRERLSRILLNPLFVDHIVTSEGEPFVYPNESLTWRLRREFEEYGDYLLELILPNGRYPAAPLFAVGGNVNCYITGGSVYNTAPLLRMDVRQAVRIPAKGIQSGRAVRLLEGLGVPLPEDLADRVVSVTPEVRLRCWLEMRGGEEKLCTRATASLGEFGEQVLTPEGWEYMTDPVDENRIVSVADVTLKAVPGVLGAISLRDFRADDEAWVRVVGKRFPEEFVTWLETMPKEIETVLEGDLESLRSAVVTGSIQLEVTESSPDWFDLHVALSVSETELSPDEIHMLLEARGKFVRLKGKGWRRLEFDIDEEDAANLAELGLNPTEIDGARQRFHALQLASSAASRLIEKEARDKIRRRASEIQTQVKPEVPENVKAELRPYQHAGFHFLAYLSENNFGGILADDMGLGKTLQTLTWLSWLRARADFAGKPILVVCPKSVVQNWLIEAERFTPDLRATTWRGGDLPSLRRCLAKVDLVVVNYAQLRLSSAALTAVNWHAIILDEAQYIKNPASQTAITACTLKGAHRLALSGTPIENRLLDLWSIMQFAMPGLLGLRAQFQRQYDSRTDPMARRRLSTRVRPFVLRRNKSEVAKDLPPRIEEDLVVEMEGTQALLYSAELKRARQSLLKIKNSKELDKERFNVLTSLLRLRQICCHPGLVSDEHGYADSAKLEALTDLLEPLMEEGHKVLVFSQFVDMLERVERELDARGWDSFVLTGETEDRGELVADFQKHEGAAVFLISLRAGGMGLNLTAASYVVLFDPWWNPAVENQAIDRTHRIGQTQQVIAYRLVAKDSIEQKIRQLQRAKSVMAGDILGEESFAKALTLEDFQFLMEG